MLAVLEAGDLYPSGFVRGLIYKTRLERDGFDVLFTNRACLPLARSLRSPPRWLRVLFRAPFGERLIHHIYRCANTLQEDRVVRMAASRDVVYMSKVTSARLVRKLRERTHARLVLDFGDALWLPRYAIERFDEVLAQVDAVTTDNEITAAYVRRHNPNCTVIPDCPQIEWFDRVRGEVAKPPQCERFLLGWVGSRGTAYNLYVVWEALEELSQRYPYLHLRIVGTDKNDLPPFERISYSCMPSYRQADMIREILQMHVGLFPLQEVEACRVRGVLKATTYMSGGAVAVCSPVGQCRELIEDGVNGMLAGSTREWVDKIEQLITNEDLRHRIVRNALRLVRDHFTVDRSYALLRRVLEERIP